MKFYFYEIQKEEKDKLFDFAFELDKSIGTITKLKDRAMLLNEQQSKDYDFIACKSYRDRILCCTLFRMNENISSILKYADLENESINIDDLAKETGKDIAGSIIKTTFFAIYKDILIVNYNSPRDITNYVDWIFQKTKTPIRFKFEKKLNTVNNIALEDIKRITIGESFRGTSSQIGSSRDLDIDIATLKKLLLNKLIGGEDVMDIEDIVQAQLILKFNKKELAKKDDSLKALINIAEDSDDIKVISRTRGTISGSELHLKEERTIDTTSEKAYSWVDVCSNLRDLALQYA